MFLKKRKNIFTTRYKWKSKWKKELWSWAFTIGGAFLISLVVVTFLFRITIVSGDSMNDTLNELLVFLGILWKSKTMMCM